MLVQTKLKTFLELVGASSKEELIWMNGYLAGIVSRQTEPQAAATAKPAVNKITIAYGTETGHSKRLATDFANKAKQQGIQAKLVSLDQYRSTDLIKEEYFLTILSTHGEGEPPDAAKKFYDHIHQNGFKLEKLKFSVLALGDTAYPLFCKAGEDVDQQLHKLGGQRIVSLQKCDTDYEAEADAWFNLVLQQLSSNGNAIQVTPVTTVAKKSQGKIVHTGKVLTNINLNDRDSDKETHHIEIAAEGVAYAPGDSIGFVPENPLHLVESILSLVGADRNKTFEYRNESISLFNLLKKKLNILHLPGRVVQQYASIVQQDIPETRMGLHELLKIYPISDAQQFESVIKIMEPVTPRLYSVSSAPAAHDGELHITVAKDSFTVNDEIKHGLCSDYLCGIPVDSDVEFYVHRNDQFRLPGDNKDVIMIGPGTGIAPFRSFIAQRDAEGAAGRNWLFFGDRHFTSDFLYQTELQNWVQTGVLTKINLAFSRDQQEKIYVQHKMIAHSADIFEWIEGGAHVYVCGAKSPMSEDVENTLLFILQKHGKFSPGRAQEYLQELKEEGRYLKDVY